MNSTALGAEDIIFISEAHEKFFHEKLKEVRYQDAYHKALVYCLGISEDLHIRTAGNCLMTCGTSGSMADYWNMRGIRR